MQKLRVSLEYDNRILEFLEFAFSNALGSDRLPYPCIWCNNCLMQNRQVLHNHLQHFGIVRSYGHWVMHGEYEFDDSTDTIDDFENQYYNDIHGLSLDAFKLPKTSDVLEQKDTSHFDIDPEESNEEAKKIL